MSILDDMKEPCRSILKLFYIDNLSLKEIAVTLDYKSAECVKVQKHRCLKQLKEDVFRKLKIK
jgi:RNA polymerase sigma-70 factor (ECF subfamily)